MGSQYGTGVSGRTFARFKRCLTIDSDHPRIATPDRRWRPSTLVHILQALILVVFASLVSFSFQRGWNRAETDFPNYYTAAVLVRKGEKLRNYYDWTWFQRQM